MNDLVPTPLLLRSGLRHLRRHPWQIALAVLGVAIAVAVVAGVDLANTAAERAFALSVEGVAGKATHEIAGPRGLDDTLYARLLTDPDLQARAPLPLAPVIEGSVLWHDPDDPDAPPRTLRLLGIDPFAESAFRGFTRNLRQSERRSGDLGSFLLTPGAVVTSEGLAEDLGRAPGETFEVEAGQGRRVTLALVGLVRPRGELAQRTARNLLVVDLASAQEILGRLGQLDRIDVLAGEADGPALDALSAALPPGLELASKTGRSGALDQMTRAFRLNLEALSLLALLVGMFLIYNTMTFVVVERRPLIGTLRALGVTRRQIFALVLGEAAVVALVGSALGLLLGLWLAQGLVGLVSQTINDLYFALTVRGVSPDPLALAKALALGVGGTLLATLRPAAEATQASPRSMLQRSSAERQTRQALPRLALAGGGGIAVAGALLAIPSKNLLLGFSALFLFVLGVALLVPVATDRLARLARWPFARLFGILGSLAARGISATLSRTGVAVAALVIAVAMTIGVGLMVDSFRATLVSWLESTLIADIYVTTDAVVRQGDRPALPIPAIEALATAPGVDYVTRLRRTEVPTLALGDHRPDNPLASQLVVLELDPRAERLYTFVEGEPAAAWQGFRDGAALVSEPYAFHHDLAVGDAIELLTDRGPRRFPIAGIYTSYSSDRGLVSLARSTYDRYFDDPAVEGLALFVGPGVAVDPLVDRLRQRLAEHAPGVALTLTPNRELRRSALEVFDRTFRITGVLRLLALAVAFLGVLGALMALQLERARELATLRAQGLTPRQVYGLVSAQTGLLGLIAGLLAVPLGILLAVFLVEIINRRSFGWTLDLRLDPWILLQALGLSLVAALLAGLYPAHRMARTHPARALREE